MRKINFVVVLCMVICMLCCCNSSKTMLSGKWEAVDNGVRVDGTSLVELEFFSDGTYTSNSSNYEGNYSIDGDRIRLSGILVSSCTFKFNISKGSLTLYYDNGYG